MTFQTTLSAIPQTVVGRKHSGLTSTQTSQARSEAWMKTLFGITREVPQGTGTRMNTNRNSEDTLDRPEKETYIFCFV